MNRRGFLKRIGFTGAAVVVAPAMVLAATKSQGYCNGVRHQMEASNTVYYDEFSLEDLEKLLHDHEMVTGGHRVYTVYTDARGREQLRKAEREAFYEYLNNEKEIIT